MSKVIQLPAVLSVFLDKDYVGTLFNEMPLAFSYDGNWIANPNAKALDPKIPLQGGKINSIYIHAFFENLLPEGDQRKILNLRHQVTTVFGLLAAVGGDTAGAVMILPENKTPQAPSYQKTTWEQLNTQIHVNDETYFDDEDIAENTHQRLSISGAQFKILVSIDTDGMPLLPQDASPSSHIVKPDIIRSDIKIFASAINEAIIMRCAAHCGLPTAEIFYQATIKACVVKRYDRLAQNNGQLKRLSQTDFCQLAGKSSDVKYEIDGGPDFVDCFRLLVEHSAMPAVDQRNLLKWLFFNLCVGNNDSHAKNLSLLGTSTGLRLAPFYDLMCTRIYPGLARRFAFQIGGEFEPGKMQSIHFETLAATLGISFKYLKKIALEVANEIPSAIETACAELDKNLSVGELTLIERVTQKVTTLAKQLHQRIAG